MKSGLYMNEQLEPGVKRMVEHVCLLKWTSPVTIWWDLALKITIFY